VLVLEDLRHAHAERERGEREIRPFQAERGQTKHETRHEAHRAGGRERQPIGHMEAIHENCGGIGAHGRERSMPERNLSVVAGEQIQAEQGDGVDDHQRHLKNLIVADREREHAGE
jgi:hypothetical protein